MLMNGKTFRRKTQTSATASVSPQPIEREFVDLAREIYNFYPEALVSKEDFLNHISEYIKKGLKDYILTKRQTKIPRSNSFIDLNIDSNAS
jgi:hypothetical protein